MSALPKPQQAFPKHWVPPAANENPPFRFRPFRPPQFGKRPPPFKFISPPGGPRPFPILGGVGLALGVAGFVDAWMKRPSPFPTPMNDWQFYGRCGLPQRPYLSSSDGKGVQTGCLAGQALTGNVEPPAAPAQGAVRWSVWSHNQPIGLGVTGQHVESWVRLTFGAPTGIAKAIPLPSPGPGVNPNDQYRRGNQPQPIEPPGDPLPDPRPDPRKWRGVTISQGNPRPQPNPEPHQRRPPGQGEKENKVISRSKAISIAIFRALDTISESAELVNAVYEALPEDVRKRWEKGRDPRGLLDSAGQYGIDGADWKLQALWHNWHRVDTVAAVENIAKNLGEDKLYGSVYKHLPGNLGMV